MLHGPWAGTYSPSPGGPHGKLRPQPTVWALHLSQGWGPSCPRSLTWRWAMTCAPGVHAHLQKGVSPVKGREELPGGLVHPSAPTLARHSPLRSLASAPSLGPPSSGGLPVASAPTASPMLKLPFLARTTRDLVGPTARRGCEGGHARAHIRWEASTPGTRPWLYQVLVETWGSKS